MPGRVPNGPKIISRRSYKPAFLVERPMPRLLLKRKRSPRAVSLTGSQKVRVGLNDYL
jgi:hypothetical protein